MRSASFPPERLISRVARDFQRQRAAVRESRTQSARNPTQKCASSHDPGRHATTIPFAIVSDVSVTVLENGAAPSATTVRVATEGETFELAWSDGASPSRRTSRHTRSRTSSPSHRWRARGRHQQTVAGAGRQRDASERESGRSGQPPPLRFAKQELFRGVDADAVIDATIDGVMARGQDSILRISPRVLPLEKSARRRSCRASP